MLVSSQMIMLHANDLLDQRIIENGHFVPNMTSGSIKETVAEMIDLMNSTLEFKNLKIILAQNENYIPKFAKYDKRRLQQVLLNLLSNAVKYSQKGIIDVSMQMLELTKETALLEIKVTDEGVGLSRIEIGKLFKPFGTLTKKDSSR